MTKYESWTIFVDRPRDAAVRFRVICSFPCEREALANRHPFILMSAGCPNFLIHPLVTVPAWAPLPCAYRHLPFCHAVGIGRQKSSLRMIGSPAPLERFSDFQ